jgi:endonuclease YncB( thermonuclease family)
VIPPFTCEVVRVHDGDTFTCANRVQVRTAGIDANELDGSCHNQCAPMTGRQAQAFVSRLVLHRTLTCQPVGQSYRRVVARCTLPDGRSLSCATIAAGAAVRWDRYWREYGMGECR